MLTHHDSGNLQDFLGFCGLPKVTNPVAAITEVAEINPAISPESDDLSLSRDASTLLSMKFWRAGTLLSPLQIADSSPVTRRASTGVTEEPPI